MPRAAASACSAERDQRWRSFVVRQHRKRGHLAIRSPGLSVGVNRVIIAAEQQHVENRGIYRRVLLACR
jgi:hypothetical protein